jgi:uncharacterized repeat protein (TIGR01451 family)
MKTNLQSILFSNQILKTHKMKKLLLLMLLFTGIVKAQIVNIPDTNFKAKLIALGVDTNNDGQIQNSEAIDRVGLDVSNSNIADLTGIRSFLSIQSLNCSNNQLSTLNLSGLNDLFSFDCSNNAISAINFTGVNLNIFVCEFNQLSSLNINSMTNLELLNCNNNNLSSLNLSNMTNLLNLKCANNVLTSLNVNNSNQLSYIFCKNNLLTNLDFSLNTGFTGIDCSNNLINTINIIGRSLSFFKANNNLLTTIDLTNTTFSEPSNSAFFDCSFNQISSFTFNNTDITRFKCSNNQLTTLNLSGATISSALDCSNNQITSLVTGNSTIETIISNNNQLSTIDISNNLLISSLDVSNNQLATIFAKNGRNEFINFTNNPNLTFICADDEQISSFASVALPTTSINSYCDFTPGGNYNTIAGVSRFDSNNNGCDATDFTFNNLRINVTDGIDSGSTFTNNTGNYTIFTQSLDYSLTPALENPTYFNVSPTLSTINFPSNNFLTQVQDFCVTANGVHPDLEIVIFPVSQTMPFSEAEFVVVYKNKGNQVLSGNVAFTYDDSICDFSFSDPIASNQTVGLLNWNYSNLLPFETKSINLKFALNDTTGPVFLNLGDILACSATITPVVGDETPLDNTFGLNQTLVATQNLNFITCLEGNTLAPSQIGNYLHYSIQFENSGSENINNVVVKNVIDTNKFDIASLQVISASAGMRTVITNNIVEFIFENINLDRRRGTPPVGGHGDILLKIKTKPSLPAGSSVMSTASIYFDYNLGVLTNNEITTFATLNNQLFAKDDSILVYPNPTNSIINVEGKNTISTIDLYDIQGRMIQTTLNTNSIDITDKSNGIYFLKVTSDKGSKIERVIKE